ncbi:restriction endonuclease subunit S [Lactobacillus helveticus]|uniref:restriction endonuclease subunit S n=1 Tax=Lactobacillus helveticus TaxID=1587 RepID=UPI0021A645B5|nr:restriction endonuclease subunit S [Lactobacillus helveticus]MCT3415805.1 restriction endonuclease subunit S [Lactobacillus helveticus]
MNKKEVKKAPALRFKGFTNDWEDRKLGELSNIVGGGTPSTSNPEYWDGDIDWYAPAEIGEQSYVSKSKKTITELGLKKSSARILPVGTVLFTSRAGIGNTAILAKEATTNQGFQSIVPDQNKLDSYFIFSRTNELKRYGEVTGAGSTFVEISGKQMSKMPIMVPELSEQQKIGSFFKQLDNTITLHQRKLESFQFTYHEIIRRLFLKKAKWQLTKLSDLVTILDKNRKPVKKEDRLLGDTPYYGANGIQDYISGFTHKGEFILIAEDGANSLTEYPIYFVKGQIWVNNHAHVLKVNRDVSPLFLALALKQINYSKYTVGSSRNKLNLKDLENIAIFIPDNNEQQKIGQFYSNYLNYLRINKKRIQYMKQFKQFLLQNMFI